MGKKLLKKKYRIELSRVEYSLLILSIFLVGGLLFTLGLMVGYYQSRSSYEYIMQQTADEGNKADNDKITIYEVSAKNTEPEPKKIPSSLKEKPVGKQLQLSGGYGVQVASFKKKVDAERLRDRLCKKNYNAFVDIADLGKRGTWYRVRVGRFQRKKTAENLARILAKKEKLKTLVIKQ